MTASPDTEIHFEIHPSQTRVPAAERERILEAPGFGQVFTDHMITLRWTAERGWHDGKLEPYGPFSLDPATAVFHYGQELFEGLKAYRQDSGSVVMFRPQANAARFNAGCRRMAMPELPEETFLRALELLVTQDREWIPAGEGNSLYLRPFMIATQRGLGVNHPSSEYLFCVIASPAAAYFGASETVKVWLSEDYTRAAPGGTGAVKCGGNYAAAFAAQQQAVDKGCDQVVWLDAAEHEWVEEMGGMNLYFVYGSGVVGPPRDARAHRLAAARDHPRLAAAARADARHPRRGGPDLGVRLARRLRLRRADRGVRLRHRRRDHPGRGGRRGLRRLDDRRRHPGRGHHAAQVGADRHPVRPPARPLRLDLQGRLSPLLGASGPTGTREHRLLLSVTTLRVGRCPGARAGV